MRCQQCNYENIKGSLICARCFALLEMSPPEQGTREINETESEVLALPAPAPEPVSTLPTVNRGTKTLYGQAQLTLELNGKRQQVVTINDQEEITLGRVDRFTSRLPSINLTSVGAWENGVSRQHASIRRSGDNLFVIDLDSTNGTFINGTRMMPYKPSIIHDGDLIRFGLFEVTIRFTNDSIFDTTRFSLRRQARLLVSTAG